MGLDCLHRIGWTKVSEPSHIVDHIPSGILELVAMLGRDMC
jgi:hypothetical protein